MRRATLGLGALVMIALFYFVAHRGATSSSVAHATAAPPPRSTPAAANAASRLRRLRQALQTLPARAAAAPAAAEGRSLPLRHNDVPLTPEADKAYEELVNYYGPGFYTWFDSKLARRARIASCGIDEPGAAKFVIHSDADLEHGTYTPKDVEIVTTYKGEMDEIVQQCIREAVIGFTEKRVTEGPAWFTDEQRRMFGKSKDVHEIDTVGFPIEQDEIYNVFQGDASGYQELNTKQRYGWK